jgi:hypothetical protein
MPKVEKVVQTIQSYFYKKRKHTARILSGPKRETWFSAECFVALAQRQISAEGPLTHWGELCHRTIAKKLNAQSLNTQSRTGSFAKVPDVAVILPIEGKKAVGMIIENKLILADEKPGAILKSLKQQMLNAEKLWPTISVVGLVFIAGVTHTKHAKFNKFEKEIVTNVESLFAGVPTFRWIFPGRVHRIFDGAETEFAYPAMHFSLALCSFELSPLPLPSALAAPQSSRKPVPEPPVVRSLRTRPLSPKPRRSPKWNQPDDLNS